MVSLARHVTRDLDKSHFSGSYREKSLTEEDYVRMGGEQVEIVIIETYFLLRYS